jgi:hypothetical protein
MASCTEPSTVGASRRKPRWPWRLLRAISPRAALARPNPAGQAASLADESNEFRVLLNALRWFRNWPTVWWYRARPWELPPLHLCRGFTLRHRLKDLVLLQIAEVLAGRCYRQCLDEPHSGTVVDIDANIGVVALDLTGTSSLNSGLR